MDISNICRAIYGHISIKNGAIFVGFAVFNNLIFPILVTQWRRLYRHLRGADADIEVLAHLSRNFHNSHALLDGMAQSNTILAGGRALDFFVPRTADPSTSWDFYTYFSPYCVGLALKSLKDAGVEFEDVLGGIRRMAMAPPGSVFEMHIDELQAYAGCAASITTTDPLIARLGREALLQLRRNPNRDAVELQNGTHIVLLRDPRTSLSCITGRARYNDSDQVVRLMFQKGMGPLEHVLSSRTSSLQCLITPYGVAHLYYRLATRRKAYCWPYNGEWPDSPNAIQLVLQSKESWSITVADGSASVRDRRLNKSWESWHATFNFRLNVDQELQRARKEVLRNIRWEESEGETRILRSEPRSLRRVLAKRRKERRQGGTEDPMLTAADELARKHTIVFQASVGTVYEFPDELIGL